MNYFSAMYFYSTNSTCALLCLESPDDILLNMNLCRRRRWRLLPAVPGLPPVRVRPPAGRRGYGHSRENQVQEVNRGHLLTDQARLSCQICSGEPAVAAEPPSVVPEVPADHEAGGSPVPWRVPPVRLKEHRLHRLLYR